jgi:hypothetical protein
MIEKSYKPKHEIKKNFMGIMTKTYAINVQRNKNSRTTGKCMNFKQNLKILELRIH